MVHAVAIPQSNEGNRKANTGILPLRQAQGQNDYEGRQLRLQLQPQPQIPFGDDNKKSNCNRNCNRNRRSFDSVVRIKRELLRSG